MVKMDYGKYLTVKEKAVVYKRQRTIELQNEGYKREQAWLKLNEELKDLGFDTISIAYINKYWNKQQNII